MSNTTKTKLTERLEIGTLITVFIFSTMSLTGI